MVKMAKQELITLIETPASKRLREIEVLLTITSNGSRGSLHKTSFGAFCMNPQPDNRDREYSFSNWTATANDIVISWLAFRELLSRESLVVGCGPSEIFWNLFNRGWSRRSL